MNSTAPSVAVNASGRAAVAWVAGNRVLLRRSKSARSFGGVETVAREQLNWNQSVAVGSDGRIAVIWLRRGRGDAAAVRAAVARAGHRVARSQTIKLSTPTVGAMKVVAVRDRFVAVWGHYGNDRPEIEYAVAGRNGRFGRVRTLAFTGRPFVDVVTGAAGEVVVGFMAPPPTDPQDPFVPRLATAVLHAGASTFDAPQVISGDEAPGGLLDGAVFAGPGGIAAGLLSGTGESRRLATARLGADGKPGPVVVVGDVDVGPGRGPSMPALALPLAGSPLAAWTISEESGPNDDLVSSELNASVQRVDGTFAPPKRLAEANSLARDVVANATHDTAVLVWNEQGRLRYAVRHKDGPLSKPEQLDRGVRWRATVASAGHHAVAGWVSGHRVRASQLSD